MAEVPSNSGRLLRFAHDAMATTFEILIAGEEPDYAAQAARAAFEELDRLEGELTRFRSTSDVARLCSAPAGEWQRLGPAALRCLELARYVWELTGGAYDPTVGLLLDAWRAAAILGNTEPAALEDIRARTGLGLVEIDAATGAARCLENGLLLDFGALGKGYAVDRMAALLREDWSIGAALIHGGQSSVYGFGAQRPGSAGWVVAVRDPAGEGPGLGELVLDDAACSGSGVRLRGAHIIDPRSGRPVSGRAGAWCSAQGSALPADMRDAPAALSDAFSTAFMLMEGNAISACCARVSGLGALIQDAAGDNVPARHGCLPPAAEKQV